VLESSLVANLVLVLICAFLLLRLHEARKRIGHDAKTEIVWFWRVSGKVEKLVHRARRGGQRIAIAMLDIDHFKNVNDSHTNHQFGDRVLRDLCKVILSTIRSLDLLARYGGEEFVIVFPLDDGVDSVRSACERIRLAIEEHVFEDGLRLTVSIGAAICPDNGTSLEDLLERADAAMYAAKDSGRNRVQLA